MSPDGSTKPPPEEKLLKLIRAKAARPEAAAPALPQGGGLTAAAVGRSLGPRRPRWTTLAAGGFILVLIIEAAYLVIELTQPLPTVSIALRRKLMFSPMALIRSVTQSCTGFFITGQTKALSFSTSWPA